MRAAVALLLCACAHDPALDGAFQQAGAEPKPELAIAKVVIPQREGVVVGGGRFGIVLTRPVEQAANALTVRDKRLGAIAGKTVWLDRQALYFEPNAELRPGLDLRFHLTATLRAPDGATISPRELAHARTRPISFWSANPVGYGEELRALGALEVKFEEKIPAAELQSIAVLLDGSAELPFMARDEGSAVRITAAFPPGHELLFTFRDDVDTATSVGVVAAPHAKLKVAKGFRFTTFGEPGDQCVEDNKTMTLKCGGAVAYLVLDSPTTQASIDANIHPAARLATTGDLRGHRIELAVAATPTVIKIDKELTDVFGQTLGKRYQFTLLRK